MEHRFKRDPDNWQAFPAKKSELFAIFEKRDTTSEFGTVSGRFACADANTSTDTDWQVIVEFAEFR
jgi:hypothetical protein